MKIKRDAKENDQEKILYACSLINGLVHDNLDIEGAHWVSAFFALIVDSIYHSGFSYEEFREETMKTIENAKPIFKK